MREINPDINVSCDELKLKADLTVDRIIRDNRYAKFDGARANIIQALEDIEQLWKE